MAPTFVTEYRDAQNIDIDTSRTVSVTTAVGDVLVCWAVNADAAHTINTPTGGTGLTWTLVTSNTGNGSYCEAWIWKATATTAETFTFTITAGGTYRWVYGVQRWSGASGVGAANNTNVSSGAPSLSLTTTAANSGICIANGDWNAGSITGRTWRSVNGSAATETFAQQVTSAPSLTAYAGYHTDAGTAGAKTVGLSAPSGQKYTIVAAEILAQTDVAKAGSDTVTFALSDNATVTEKIKAGSDAVTFALTDNGVAGIPVPKAGSDTVTFALTDNAAAPDEYTIKSASDTVIFGVTDSASRQVIAPVFGTWTSPAIALPDDPIAGSIILWDATLNSGSVVVETSTDNAATWQEVTNRGPVGRLPIGSSSARAVLVRVTLSRTSPEDASPALHRLEMRLAIDSSVDEYCQLGRFMLNDTEVVDSPAGLVLRMTGADLSRRIERNTWDESLVIEEGTNSRDAIIAVISNRWPEATYNLASTELTTTRLFYGPGLGGGNPWQDARKIARDAGWELFLDAYGVVTSRPVPDPDVMPAVWVFEDSAHPTILDLARRMTDEATFNQVIVTGESTSNEVPVTASWRDLDPTSRTYWDGPYGHVTKTIRSEQVRTPEQAQQVADAEGLKVKGATEIVRINVLTAPFLEPGDIVEVDRTASKTIGRFAVDAWRIPIGPEEDMSLTCRRQRQ